MRTDFDEGAKQSAYQVKCSVCGRQVYESLVQKCPKSGTHRCMYCCRRICTELSPVFNGWQCTGKGENNGSEHS